MDVSAINPDQWLTRASLAADVAAMGIGTGDMVMAHVGMRAVGPVLGGADSLIGALRDAVGRDGTLVAYTSWDGSYEELFYTEGRVPEAWRPHIPPFDPQASRAVRMNGIFAECVRTTPGAIRSANPGASIAAIGQDARWLAADHPLDFGYGPGTPFARLVERNARVLMIGAPHDTMTILHHAEHLAPIQRKRERRYDVPLAAGDGPRWVRVREYDTSEPVRDDLPEDYFATVVSDYLATGAGRAGHIGLAEALVVDAAPIVSFAVDWLKQRFPN